MLVREAMTGNAVYVPATTTLQEAARLMKDRDTGFLPIADTGQDKLEGVVTDRDIAIRGIAEGMDPSSATVKEVETDRALYCFQDDSVEAASKSMREQQVYRLVVLDNKDDKRLQGVISLGDIIRHGQDKAAMEAESGIVQPS